MKDLFTRPILKEIDKLLVTDLDGNKREFFYTKSDSEVHKIEDPLHAHETWASNPSCC
jgi:hypothetical protein